MPSNIEIKARVADPARKREIAERLSGGPPQILRQRDIFFPCAHGRLKLREFPDAPGELIAYSRPDTADAKQSDYSIARTDSPAALRQVLSSALGTGRVVSKTRWLYLVGQTRIHLDEVENLGWFLELEFVLYPGQPAEEGERVARDLMSSLEINEGDLIQGAYADLLADSGGK
jgi:adenylate cyclase class IV